MISAMGKTIKAFKQIEQALMGLMESGRKVILKDLIVASSMCKRTVITYWNKYFKSQVLTYNKEVLGIS